MQISQVLAEMRALQARASGISEAPAAAAQPSDFANLMKDSVDHVAGKMESIEIIQNRHIEWRGNRALLLVAAHV